LSKKIARLLLTALGALLGLGLVSTVNEILQSLGAMSIHILLQTWAVFLIYGIMGLTTGIITYIYSPKLIEWSIGAFRRTEKALSVFSLFDLFVGVTGLVIGLLIAWLASTFTIGLSFDWLKLFIHLALYVSFGSLGWTLLLRHRAEIAVPEWFNKKGKKNGVGNARPKVLDTSAIIDGRVADICSTGLIEGRILIPQFVLLELQHIADSADPLKRGRGRRGLDILAKMQQELPGRLEVVDTDYEDIPEVDAKLIRLAFEVNGTVVTNDFNLNKVAGVQGVPVFNINALANAVKNVMIPGEEFTAAIVREGKEPGQGVAYLDDGTMIVVNGAKKHMGEEVGIVVTSVLQTPAGRMIFGKLKNA